VRSPEHAATIIEALLAAARRRILILGPVIDLPIFRTEATCDYLSRFLAAHRRNEIRLLLDEPREFTLRHPRLSAVYRRLSPGIDIRRLPESFLPLDEGFLVTDSGGHYRQPRSDRGSRRSPAVAAEHDPATARELLRAFDALWNHGEPVPELVTTGLR
jgi:hypothetical protein